MSEQLAKFKQYEYRTNSNLVLKPASRGAISHEGSTDPTSLWGRVKGKMGDRVAFTKPNLDQLRKRAKENRKDESKIIKKQEKSSVIAVKLDDAHYQPKTTETRAAYVQLLSILQKCLGDQPSTVYQSYADEVLTLLKDDNLHANKRREKVQSLLGISAETTYSKLVAIGKLITDFIEEDDVQEIDGDEAMGLVFDDSSEEEGDGFTTEIKDLSDDEDEGDDVTSSKVTALGTNDADEDDAMEVDENYIDPKSIDTYWLQRKISQLPQFDKEPTASQKMAKEVLAILSDNSITERKCQNLLVDKFDVDNFDLITLLMSNRKKIVFCTKYKQAQNKEEKQQLQKDILGDSDLQKIFNSLEGNLPQESSEVSTERSLRLEANRIKGKSDVNAPDEEELAFSGRRNLDLDSLSFNQGGHFMSNKVLNLTGFVEGCTRIKKKGYEEVHIPALKAPPISSKEKLVPFSALPKWAQLPFKNLIEKKHSTLNRIQSKVYNATFGSSENVLICAPTGAGKTNCALLTMLHEIGLYRDEKTGEIDLESFKIVYIAPMKSLVREMVGKFQGMLKEYGITVRELSGDVNLTKQQISTTQVIVTTPEKWDIVTRKSGDRTFTQLVRLVIIDEIHLLHDERGPVLEAIVARTLRQIESTQELVRLVGLSATLPNYEDVATFLRVDPNYLFHFSNNYRPVPLEQQFIGVSVKKPLQRFQLMNEITYDKVMQVMERSSSKVDKDTCLIFVHSRKETVKTAKAIRDMALENDKLGAIVSDAGTRAVLQKAAEEMAHSNDLKDLLPYGFAMHHAGMSRDDRNLVEDLFAQKCIKLLVSTATLAWGVNLPAHSVIIKGTQVYNPEKGSWVELSPLDVMQMLGRAGRPQYDKKGEGLVITTQSELQYYGSLMNEQLPIESQLISRLPDILNAEIVMGTIQNLSEAVNWLGYTYLYICMLRSPTLYGISHDDYDGDKLLMQRRVDLIHSAAMLLDKHNLIKYDRKTGNFQMTNLGRVASHYYINHHSIATYNEHLKPTFSDIDILRLFSLSDEFKYITIRQEERLELEKLLDQVPIPVKEGVEEPAAKINVLLQAYISRLKLDGFALMADMVYVTQSAGRIMRALFEIVLKRGWAQLTNKLLALCNMIQRRMWSSQSPLRQFPDVSHQIIMKLEGKSFLPFERLYDLSSREIGELIDFAAQGKTVYRRVHQFPRLDLSAHVQPITRSMLKVELTITPDFKFEDRYHGNAEGFWVWVEDVDGEIILHHEYFILKKKYSKDDHDLSFVVPLFEPLPPQYFIKVISDRWLGSETILPISFASLILPEKYPPHTELVDLRANPISELKNKKYENLYKGFKEFNAIQTQAFSVLYGSDSNVLLAAPTGSGKTVCAELTILRMLAQRDSSDYCRCVYIAPYDGLANERFVDWTIKFEKSLGANVVQLTGESSIDLKLLEVGNIIISTPEKWDMISRRWRQRKNVRNINLFIVDELHLIGSEHGPILEVIVSRARYISSQTGIKTRIAAFSTSLANARDLGLWVGATNKTIFNFHPNARPVPLEIHLQSFDQAHFDFRMIAMSKPAIQAITHHSNGKPSMIFCPSRKQALNIAKDLRTYCIASDNDGQFLHLPLDDLKQEVPKSIKNPWLLEFLPYGIGIYHEYLSDIEKQTIEDLFDSGALQILISTRPLCWGMSLSAHLIVIMGTQYYDGKQHTYVDYPIPDILQMMGRASRPLEDQSGKCFIFCHAPKKNFYKKFLYDPLPVESHLDLFFADHLNAAIVTKIVENAHNAVDFLTWTFFYRRLTQNPNYYSLQGTTHRHISDHLSELVEKTLEELKECQAIAVDEEDITPLNLGMISAYYYIQYSTTDLFSCSLTEKTKLKGLIEILSAASEFDRLPIRRGEQNYLAALAGHLPVKIDQSRFDDARVKTNVLLQCHFSRKPLKSSDIVADQKYILENIIKLIQALVDVISSNGWLSPALAAMELSQMVIQARWSYDSFLNQLPHFSDDIIKRCAKSKVESIFDIMELEDDERDKILQLNDKQMQDVAEVCNRYPTVDVNYEVADKEDITTNSTISIKVQLERDIDDDEELTTVTAPYYPKDKAEGWWLVVGDSKSNQLLSVKKVTLNRNAKLMLNFPAPAAGDHKLTLYFMCDSYSGCDQEYSLDIHVEQAPEEEEDDEEEEEDVAMED